MNNNGNNLTCNWGDCYNVLSEAEIVTHVENHIENLRKQKCQYVCMWKSCPRSLSNKPFSERYMLLRHMRLHTKEMPFKCNYCAKAFSTQEQRLRHEVSHTGQRQLVCSVCGKCFSRTSERAKCERAHKKDLFACSKCDKKYLDAGTLRHHRHRRHPEEYRKVSTGNEPSMISTVYHNNTEVKENSDSSYLKNITESNDVSMSGCNNTIAAGDIIMLLEESPTNSIITNSSDDCVVDQMLLSDDGDASQRPYAELLFDIDSLLPYDLSGSCSGTGEAVHEGVMSTSLPPISSFTKQVLFEDFFHLSKDGALDLTGGLVMHDAIDDHHPQPQSSVCGAMDLRCATYSGEMNGQGLCCFSFTSLLNSETPVDLSVYGDIAGTSEVASTCTTSWTLNLNCSDANRAPV